MLFMAVLHANLYLINKTSKKSPTILDAKHLQFCFALELDAMSHSFYTETDEKKYLCRILTLLYNGSVILRLHMAVW